VIQAGLPIFFSKNAKQERQRRYMVLWTLQDYSYNVMNWIIKSLWLDLEICFGRLSLKSEWHFRTTSPGKVHQLFAWMSHWHLP